MIILTNCLASFDDEGSLKVAGKLIEELRKKLPETTIVTYENASAPGDVHLKINKLMLSLPLARLLRKRREALLYVPASTRMLPAAVRAFVLSLYSRRKLHMLIPLCAEAGTLAKILLRLSGAGITVFSQSACESLVSFLPGRVHCLKAAVDTKRFVPADAAQKSALRWKYGLPEDKTIVLHVGHMKYGRNVDKLMELEEDFHGVLVASTATARFKDADLEQKLREKKNITIIDTYIPQIEELYQLSDVYFFPVVEKLNCIDVPLSAFEAAACNVPVVATPYGALQQMMEKDGFFAVSSFEKKELNALLRRAAEEHSQPRRHVLEYDWNLAAQALLEQMKKEGLPV